MSNVRPWARYFARYIDIFIFSLIIGFVIPIPHHYMLKYLFLIGSIILVLWMFIEPLLLSTWGTTIGKALLKVRLRTKDDNKLSYWEGLKRSFKVCIFGLGLGLPFISIITLIAGYTDLKRLKMTTWDRDGQFVITHGKIGILRGFLVMAFYLLLVVISVIGLAKIAQNGIQTPIYSSGYPNYLISYGYNQPNIYDNYNK